MLGEDMTGQENPLICTIVNKSYFLVATQLAATCM